MTIVALLIVLEIACFGFTRSLAKEHYKDKEWDVSQFPPLIRIVLLVTYVVAFFFSLPLQIIHTVIGNLQKES